MTAVVTLAVVWYERRRGRELASAFLLADAAHTSSALCVTMLALGSLLLSRIGLGVADPVLALVVAGVIAWNGYQILRETVPILVDQRGVDAEEIRARLPHPAQCRRATRAIEEHIVGGVVRRSHDRRRSGHDRGGRVRGCRRGGGAQWRRAVEARIGEALGAAQITVHVEPA